MNKFLKILFYGFSTLIILVGIIIILLIQRVDRTPYKETDYYQKMSTQLDTFSMVTKIDTGEFLKVGWHQESITPKLNTPLAGYGLREKASCIHDSVFVRVFVFDNGKTKVAFITLDLLIFPPTVKSKLYNQLVQSGFQPENLYMAATHTHSGPGGWAHGIAGSVLAGNYDEAYTNFIVDKIILGIQTADKNKASAKLSTIKIEAGTYVKNRINMDDSKVDPWIRVLKIEKENGENAAMVLYSAHATCLKVENTCISGDYPSRLNQQLIKSGKLKFVMYVAGMVGSHIPTNTMDKVGDAYVNQYADSLSALILNNIDSTTALNGTILGVKQLNLYLREPHLKISKDWRLKPWVFDWLFGDYYPTIKILKINDLLFIGTPCDFSGELMPEFEDLCMKKNSQLYITSFNGDYIGYVNVDKYYDEDKAETRNMNWFGPYNQAYFTEIIQKILTKI